MNIVTVCRAGLVRSVALADVLKLHFRIVDVIPVGCGTYQGGRFQHIDTLNMLYKWADTIVVMEGRYKDKVPEVFHKKVVVCEVGQDTYGTPKNPELIRKVWDWTRKNTHRLGIMEDDQVR